MSPERILVRAPSWIGDAVMATPTLRALRGHFPSAEIVAEGRPGILELWRGLPSLDAFLPDPGTGLRGLGDRVDGLRRQRFDRAVLLPDSVRAALGPFLAGIPHRTGYARDPLRRALLTQTLRARRARGRPHPLPTVQRYLAIAEALGARALGTRTELRVPEAGRAGLAGRLQGLGIARHESLLVVAPGAGFGPSKRWPAERFAAAADALVRRYALRGLVAPGPGEEILARRVERASTAGLRALRGALGIGEWLALTERAQLVLANDAGARHVAVALGRPVVTLLGPTHPAHGHSDAAAQRVLRRPPPCSPCQRRTCPFDHGCMTAVSVEEVVAAAAELLGD